MALQKLEFETKNIQSRVAKQMSQYSENVRVRMGQIADFKNEYDKLFSGFIQFDLPKDETYLKLEAELELQDKIKQAKKNGNTNILGNPKALPKV